MNLAEKIVAVIVVVPFCVVSQLYITSRGPWAYKRRRKQ